jgi:iron complex transport system permease protein
MTLRLPRILTAALVGLLLAQSGAIFQGLVRNPLASPDLIGINAGASLATVFWIVTHRSPHLLPWVAFVGAMAAAGAVYGLSWQGKISNTRLILVGIGVNALLTAGVTLLIVRAGINDASKAYQWMTGSVYASSWVDVRRVGLAALVLLPLGMGLMGSLGVMQVGELTARSLGVPLERTRLALILVGCGASAAAIAAAGPVGFVALMVPHIARMLAGPMTSGVLLFTGLAGGILLLSADMIGQHALPVAMPVGVLTAALGAPYFLFLLYRSNLHL